MTSTTPVSTTDTVLICDRCGTPLHPGTGDFFQVHILAVADPSPPVVSGNEEPAELRRKIENLLAEMQSLSPQEAMDQVYRRVIIYLCNACYHPWIENPAGS
jgi:hypothetical protein